MRQVFGVCGAVVAALAVAVPIGIADDGGTGTRPAPKPTVACARAVFAAKILRVGSDAVGVLPAQSETGKPIVVRLADDTVVRQGDAVTDTSALAAGKLARFAVRACRSGDRRSITARVIGLVPAGTAAGGSDGSNVAPAQGTEPKPAQGTEPKPATEVCGQGEMDTILVAVSPASITVRTSSTEGTKEWPVAVNGDTVVRKNDLGVPLSALAAGDRVHVVLVRCPSGSVRALRIVFLGAAAT
jgi:hypothetical protein